MPKVTVYTVPRCLDCAAVKNLLSDAGIEFEEIDISQIEHSRDALEMLSGVRGMPQVFIDGRFIGQVSEIRYLIQTGELASMIEGQSDGDSDGDL